jgi:hypothetical protein
MNRLLYVVLLQLGVVCAQGQAAQHTRLPKQPDALVQSLYSQVVARHPSGIPYGADKRIFSPYLSESLLHKIDLATACSRDWVRQNQGRILKGPFGWAESGLFSGANERTDPLAFQIERTELEKDGSYLVYVRLSGGAPPDKPWTWEVAVKVVKKNEHPVVDDVIYLKDKDQDVEYRLSESLGYGCGGPRWVGRSNQPR